MPCVAPAAALLASIGEQRGSPVPAPYASVFRAVPRHLFLPGRIWVRDGHGGYRPLDRSVDPDAWARAAYSDQPLVTQLTDGAPTSSASMPSMVLYQLELAGIADLARQGDGDNRAGVVAPRVLELGTGTGFNAGLLAALLGQDAVTTLDLDPSLTTQAQRNLKTAGYAPTVIEADAAAGWPPGAPYNRILATFSVDSIPDAWRAQVRPEGLIVTPWYSDWTAYGMLSLAVAADGVGQGRFHPQGSYMTMRTHHPAAQAPAVPGGAARHPGPGTAAMARASTSTSRTCLSPWAVSGDPDTEFHLGLTVPNTSYDWDTSGEHAPIRLALYSADGSVAAVDYDGHQAHEFTVTQTGRRRLWDETEAAYARWERFGRPGVERHGLTITPDSTHHVWIDDPKQRLPSIQ
ncbi:protein-L-isoaspartate O-methyltransferase family protein [Streptomyces hundungensis]|uniref:protein-L-isoaspartate O-methyltransferase family protein n=1 Tax=Streptomyces hundungensis TaxID=1077946 RepID=UPI0033E010F2